MFYLVQIIVPSLICVVLPVGIVWIVMRNNTNKVNKSSEVIIKAIESNTDVDVNKLIEVLGQTKQTKRTPEEISQRRLLRGSLFSLLGIAFALVSIIASDSDLADFMFLASGVMFAFGISYLIVYFVYRKPKAIEE